MTSDFTDSVRARLSFFDRLLIVATVFFAMFMATSMLVPLVGKVLPPDSRGALLLSGVLQNVLAFIVTALVAAKVAFGNTARFLALDTPPTWKGIAGATAVFILAQPALNQIIYWNSAIQFPEALAGVEDMMRSLEEKAAAMTAVMLSSTSWGGLVTEVLTVGVLTGFSEELFFRGTLQRAGASRGAHHTAIWVTALIFSAIHFQAFGFVPRLLLGAWFGYLLYWTGSIYTAAYAHVLNNSVVVVCTWLSLRYGSDFNPEMLGVAETGFPVAAFISTLATLAFIFFLRPYLWQPPHSGK